MPRHKQVTTCRKSGGPVSKMCTCERCQLAVCEVCGAGEGSLTTDCPGTKVNFDKQQEVIETNLNFTDERGWHQGDPTERRSPRFEKHPASNSMPNPALDHDCPACRSKRGEDCWIEMSLTGHPMGELVTIDGVWTHLERTKLTEQSQPSKVVHAPRVDLKYQRITGCTCGWRTPNSARNSDAAFTVHATLAKLSPETDWSAMDRAEDLKHELAQKAIAWVQADRICEDHSATLTRLEDEGDVLLPKSDAKAAAETFATRPAARELRGQLKHAQIDFRLADQRAQKCDEEFRQAARKLVEALEQGDGA